MSKLSTYRVGGFKVKQFNLVAEEERASYTLIVKVDKPVTSMRKSVSYYSRNTIPMTNLYDFYVEHFERRCSHDYDCCGCWFTNLQDIKRKGSKIILKIGTARNY